MLRGNPAVLLALAVLLFPMCILAGSPRETLGIAPQDQGYYASNFISCRDGSKKFSREQLNDEFCDCPDGTDEPGTSACPEGKFYCRNIGHTPITIFSSRVNDGICDCCDGSDEYFGKVNCSNTCWEAGKIARERMKNKIATYKQGVTLRQKNVEEAKVAFSKDEAELAKLKNDEKVLKELVQKLKEKKEQIEKAEEQDRLKKEAEEKIQREKEKNITIDTNGTQEDLETFNEDASDRSHDSTIVKDEHHAEDTLTPDHEVNKAVEEEAGVATSGSIPANDVETVDHSSTQNAENDVVEESDKSQSGADAAVTENAANPVEEEQKEPSLEGLSKDEIGRIIASRWTGEKSENTEHKTDIDASNEEDRKDVLEYPEPDEGEESDGYNSETDEYKHKYDDDDGDNDLTDDNSHEYDPELEDTEESLDFTASGSTSWLGKIQLTVQNILQKVNIFKSPVNITEAAHVRKEYDNASSKLSKIQSRMSSLTEKLKQDFGLEKEFYSFYDHCFEIKENKYVYKVCPFKKASQVEGYSTTRLGNWEKFDEAYRIMQFSNGDKCWNGPDRSIKIRLRCGLKNELTDVDEPTRCEYTAFLSTPLMCREEKIMEFERKLELLNSGQLHDEL
ncbi:hypothetical protein ZOSMA_44G00170 [Zostera marina]|uniref:Glucosidase 2 subunit beta n=1 Tax=Zostera marina TaxID=29655 RepID=A0A0K9P0X6_ZOSMR|nr:hypothetical protein ZOSMA_44G00170 [Zostera marina]